jgi:hypothetical protein
MISVLQSTNNFYVQIQRLARRIDSQEILAAHHLYPPLRFCNVKRQYRTEHAGQENYFYSCKHFPIPQAKASDGVSCERRQRTGDIHS